MNTEDAKLILSAVQNGAEPDSETEKAFALLESDPALQEWFEEEQAFDKAISSKLAEIEPPADLKANLLKLLNEESATSELSEPEPQNVTWFRPPLLAAAAAVILIPILAIQMFTGSADAKDFNTFRSDMVEFASSNFKLDHTEESLPALYDWLNENDATCPTELSTSVAVESSVGCKVLEWNDESVTLICLRNDTNQVIHCFVLPHEEVESLPAESLMGTPFMMDELETCCWTDDDFLYLMVGSSKGVKLPTPKK